jgi:hypothetical protein
MHYAIIVYETDESMSARDDAGRAPAYWGSYVAYAKALREAGIARGGAGLEAPRTATTVRLRDGERQVQDGPFADTKERLGGFFLIEVDDLDQALAWAARCPGASLGSVEVRPVMPTPGAS